VRGADGATGTTHGRSPDAAEQPPEGGGGTPETSTDTALLAALEAEDAPHSFVARTSK
jgi:hypothetical protein